MTVEMEITCRRCGQTYTPMHRDYVRGLWHHCPACRDDLAPIPPDDRPIVTGPARAP